MTRKDFVNEYDHVITPLAKQFGMFPEIVFSQAFIEGSDGTGKMGESYTMKHGNNIFNVRPGTGWQGATISNPYVKSESKIFRAYDSIEDGIKDYFNFLASNKRYHDAGVFSAQTIEAQAKALQDAHYAGNSTTYAALITSLANDVKGLKGQAVKVIKNVQANWYYYAAGTVIVIGAVAVKQKWIKL